MSDVVIQSLVIIVPIGALVLGMYYFQSKQMNAIENRMREDRRESENRLRAEIKVVAESVETAKSELRAEIVASEDRLSGEIVASEDRLRAEIVAAEERLRGEIKVVAESVEKGDSDLNHRMDRTDDKISQLIQDVGVVQGAVLGIPTRAGSREPEPTATG